MRRTKNRHLSIRSIIIIPLVSMAVTTILINIFVGETANPTPNKKDDEVVASVNAKHSAKTSYGLPSRLTIPKINVTADIQLMGLTDDGDMEAPKTNEEVGWYQYGARPGDEGSAVIAGHFGIDGEAVFGQLNSLKKADVITITDEHQREVSFAVTETRRYSYDAAPKEVFTSSSGAHLNLITCDGAWKAGQNTFADRLVVFTTKI